jgi:hypothetical protein
MLSIASDFQQLFTEAKTALSTEQKLNALQQALELCKNKDLLLTSQVFFQFLEFVSSPDPQVRKWVAKTVEIVCKQRPHIQCTQILVRGKDRFRLSINFLLCVYDYV